MSSLFEARGLCPGPFLCGCWVRLYGCAVLRLYGCSVLRLYGRLVVETVVGDGYAVIRLYGGGIRLCGCAVLRLYGCEVLR